MCVCVCVCGLDNYLALVLICLIQILFAIAAIRENLWVHIQCICRFVCVCVCAFVCMCVCVCVCVCVCERVLFAEGLNTRPRHGPKKRWRDIAAADLSARCVAGDWCDLAQDRRDWRLMCNRPRPAVPKPRVFICGCGRDFRRPNDLTRHRKYCNS